MKTRTWSRGIVTTYAYDQGQMVSTDYSDATPDVVYSYDNFGRPTLVTQAEGIIDGSNVTLANQHAYIYDPATLVLDKESISYANGLSRTLDRSQDGLLRPAGFQLMNGTTEEHATSYGYDGAGRLAGVHTAAVYSATPDFSYEYLANSGSLVHKVTGPAHKVINTYETTRNVLETKTNERNVANVDPISAFDYTVNDIGQRSKVDRTGDAFSSANTETWNYNPIGELTRADHSVNNSFDRTYQFDGIGNRKKSADSLTLPATDNYTANALNQLEAANGATRLHDEDGNLTDNGPHLYFWDAENRLIEIKKKSDNSTVATYAYDYQSRRITKTVGSTVTNFVYDDWNPIAEFSGTTLSKSYVWGMDLSGSMQGAGGVGGLLAVNDGSATYYPTFCGNGNVSQYLDSTGTPVAHYEYDAFGQVVASGAKKDDFTHQFSTKQFDGETELHYYGYRYYDVGLGSWLNRDPIEERGGVNLYSFVGNDGVNWVDFLGLRMPDPLRPPAGELPPGWNPEERPDDFPIDLLPPNDPESPYRSNWPMPIEWGEVVTDGFIDENEEGNECCKCERKYPDTGSHLARPRGSDGSYPRPGFNEVKCNPGDRVIKAYEGKCVPAKKGDDCPSDTKCYFTITWICNGSGTAWGNGGATLQATGCN